MYFHQEIKETGALSSRVLAVYWKAWGSTLGLLIILSLILMQASRNLSDTWLAYWIKSINSSNATWTLVPNTSADLKTYRDTLQEYLACIFDNLFAFKSINDCKLDERVNVTLTQVRASQNSYYLAIYIGIAVFNSLIALIRSFAFAYAGIKAAKFIHDRLLNSVIFVRIHLSLESNIQFSAFVHSFSAFRPSSVSLTSHQLVEF